MLRLVRDGRAHVKMPCTMRLVSNNAAAARMGTQGPVLVAMLGDAITGYATDMHGVACMAGLQRAQLASLVSCVYASLLGATPPTPAALAPVRALGFMTLASAGLAPDVAASRRTPPSGTVRCHPTHHMALTVMSRAAGQCQACPLLCLLDGPITSMAMYALSSQLPIWVSGADAWTYCKAMMGSGSTPCTDIAALRTRTGVRPGITVVASRCASASSELLKAMHIPIVMIMTCPDTTWPVVRARHISHLSLHDGSPPQGMEWAGVSVHDAFPATPMSTRAGSFEGCQVWLQGFAGHLLVHYTGERVVEA